MPIPESTSKIRRSAMLNRQLHHIKKPDTTNLQKFAEDVLSGIVFEDDRQVVWITSKKIYSEKPRTVITVTKIQDWYSTQAENQKNPVS